MTVYVDNMGIPADVHNAATGRTIRGRWSHLTADTREELVTFAVEKLGLRASYFQTCKAKTFCPPATCPHFHFDVTAPKRELAIAAGAQAISLQQWGDLIRAHREATRREGHG